MALRELEEIHLRKTFLVPFNNDHMRIFASKDKTVKNKQVCYIYCLTNRQRLNNMQSCMEVEVFKFEQGDEMAKRPTVV